MKRLLPLIFLVSCRTLPTYTTNMGMEVYMAKPASVPQERIEYVLQRFVQRMPQLMPELPTEELLKVISWDRLYWSTERIPCAQGTCAGLYHSGYTQIDIGGITDVCGSALVHELTHQAQEILDPNVRWLPLEEQHAMPIFRAAEVIDAELMNSPFCTEKK